MSSSEKFYFQCSDCGKKYRAQDVRYLCPNCAKENTSQLPPKGVLQTFYDYERIKQKFPSSLFSQLRKNDFLDILPIHSAVSLSFLKVGNTPFYEIPDEKSDNIFGKGKYFLKDDSQNPTFSYKDRASNLVSAYAKENDWDTIVAASTGNAGSSLAGICAAQGQKAIIFAPATAPKAKLMQMLMYGAQVIPVQGNYDDAFEMSIDASRKFGWYNRNTAYNPLTIEGKKSVSWEIFEQLGKNVPDRIFVPVGDGCIISGVFKGFEDLMKLGIIQNMPTIVAVQSEKSDNLIQNLKDKKFVSHPSKTIADSISVDVPRNFHLTKKYLQSYQGDWITVSDEDILKASRLLSENCGIFSEPAAAASFAGALAFSKKKNVDAHSQNVILLTGSGLKDVEAISKICNLPTPISDISELQKRKL